MRSPKSRQTEEMSVSHHATSLFDWYAEFRDSHRTRSHKRIENDLNGLACEINTVGSLEHDDYIIGCLFPTPWKKPKCDQFQCSKYSITCIMFDFESNLRLRLLSKSNIIHVTEYLEQSKIAFKIKHNTCH